ncbi:MAG TPA: ABC transporter substrate-binding protein [Actinomycetota bacterium]
MKRIRSIAALVALGMLTVACSGSLPDWHYGKRASDTTVTLVDPDGEPVAGGPADGTTPLPGISGVPSVLPSGGTNGPLPTGGPGPSTAPTGSPKQYVANIYKGAADTIGITDSQITLCGHAALVLGAAFNVSAADLNVYWQAVNATSEKIHGRRVETSWEDDRYDGTEAAAVVKRCVAKNPFFIIGGIGFDQIPFAREEAERQKTLYLHHMAIAKGMDRAVHSFSTQPTVEQVGVAFGEYIGSKYKGQRIGIISRNSEYWKPGHDTGVAELKRRGITPRKDLETTKNQGTYNLEIGQLQDDDVKVVWIWENALAAAQIIQQAAGQGYRPKWIVFPFQTTLDLIGRDNSLSPTIEGIGTWSAYTPGGYGNAFSQYEYGAEIERFEAAYSRYRPDTTTNDILWQVWIGNKALHQLFLDCGRSCTRNKIAGAFLGGLRTRVNPNCEANFAHPKSIGGRIGLHQFIVLETMGRGSTAVWKTNVWCAEHLG